MKKTILKTSIAAALLVSVPTAEAAINYFDYSGIFTMLDSTGAVLENTSIATKGANSYQTAITGTMEFDTVTGAGNGTVVPFDFGGGVTPLDVTSFKMQAIGDGFGGSGTLLFGNMMFDWDNTTGISASIVWDAAGFFAGELTAGGANSAIPASDGTYTDGTWGYLGLGPVPIATTEWNTTNYNGCAPGDCMGYDSSGGLPLLLDTASNTNKWAMDDGFPAANQGVGGSPFQDGPFPLMSPNFDMTTLTPIGSYSGFFYENCAFYPDYACAIVTPEDEPPTMYFATPVPVPATIWLFGSGLLGLIGVARHRKKEV